MIRQAAIVVLLAGCAAQRLPRVASFEPPTVHHEELRRASEEIRARDAELQKLGLQSTATADDCPRITQLRDNICALSARICQIADEQTPGSNAAINAQADCADGKTRCKRADERALARGCSGKVRRVLPDAP